MPTATFPTIEQIWAKGLNDEQLAARLNEYAKDIRWGPLPQRVALFTEAASRLFDGEPKLDKAPLPTKKDMDVIQATEGGQAEGDQPPADPPAPPAGDEPKTDADPRDGESADAPPAAKGRRTGDPRQDRENQAVRDETDARVLAQLRTQPAGRGRDDKAIAAGMDDISVTKVRPALRRLVKAGLATVEGKLYQATIAAVPPAAEGGE